MPPTAAVDVEVLWHAFSAVVPMTKLAYLCSQVARAHILGGEAPGDSAATESQQDVANLTMTNAWSATTTTASTHTRHRGTADEFLRLIERTISVCFNTCFATQQTDKRALTRPRLKPRVRQHAYAGVDPRVLAVEIVGNRLLSSSAAAARARLALLRARCERAQVERLDGRAKDGRVKRAAVRRR